MWPLDRTYFFRVRGTHTILGVLFPDPDILGCVILIPTSKRSTDECLHVGELGLVTISCYSSLVTALMSVLRYTLILPVILTVEIFQPALRFDFYIYLTCFFFFWPLLLMVIYQSASEISFPNCISMEGNYS